MRVRMRVRAPVCAGRPGRDPRLRGAHRQRVFLRQAANRHRCIHHDVIVRTLRRRRYRRRTQIAQSILGRVERNAARRRGRGQEVDTVKRVGPRGAQKGSAIRGARRDHRKGIARNTMIIPRKRNHNVHLDTQTTPKGAKDQAEERTRTRAHMKRNE